MALYKGWDEQRAGGREEEQAAHPGEHEATAGGNIFSLLFLLPPFCTYLTCFCVEKTRTNRSYEQYNFVTDVLWKVPEIGVSANWNKKEIKTTIEENKQWEKMKIFL